MQQYMNFFSTSVAYSSDAEFEAATTGLAMTMVAIPLIMIFAIVIVMIIAKWKIFSKAGQPGWMAIIPFLSDYILAEICGIKGLLAIIGMFIPMANFALVLYEYYCLTKVFGKDTSFFIGLLLLTGIFMPVLGFGKATYLGASASPAKTTFLASDDAKAGAAPASAAAKKDEWVDGKEAK